MHIARLANRATRPLIPHLVVVFIPLTKQIALLAFMLGLVNQIAAMATSTIRTTGVVLRKYIWNDLMYFV